jgi:hypothetical protein
MENNDRVLQLANLDVLQCSSIFFNSSPGLTIKKKKNSRWDPAEVKQSF